MSKVAETVGWLGGLFALFYLFWRIKEWLAMPEWLFWLIYIAGVTALVLLIRSKPSNNRKDR